MLAAPEVTVELVDAAGGPVCFVAYDATTLRHLAVHPDRWGTGLARLAVDRAVASVHAGGQRPRLWCLAANQQAMGCYLHLGWVADRTGAACRVAAVPGRVRAGAGRMRP